MDGFLQRFFPRVLVQRQQASHGVADNHYCQFNSQVLQLWQSSMYLAGALAGLMASWVSSRYGRRATMTAGGAAFVLGSLLQAAAPEVVMLVIGRAMLGIGIGFANQACPLYLSEMAPAHLRGSINICFQLATAIGILVANCLNYGTSHLADNIGWRLSLGLTGLPAVLVLAGSLVLPETPNSLMQRGNEQEARKVLQKVRGTKKVEVELTEIKRAVSKAEASKASMVLFRRRRHLPQLLWCIAMPVMQQYTGMNAFMFYAPQIFITLGMGQKASLLGILIVSAVNLVATAIAIYAVDRVGRRRLLLAGGAQMLVAQLAATALMYTAFSSAAPALYSLVLIEIIICVFTSAFCYSYGPLAWLIPTEIGDISTRSMGQSVNVTTQFLASFSIAQSFMSIMCRLQWGTFLFFAGCVAIMTTLVAFLLPETKGVPLEEVNGIWARHPVWGKVVRQDSGKESGDSVEQSGVQSSLPWDSF
ncbi:hypothetical protein CVIRNUC_010424 [Coccomyxa viridis]|uniref:Major facilitator superfamily (MFS) profile domain-containing protein n=1 Tax=Coccomyxa viridis TaxID=1274662 RepID=A0AAV1IIV6_9CHLO|nr:hypothetical protein CVIRNUC_010424 [Coccomyxa viridis]